MKDLESLRVADRAAWRQWLATHHDSESGIWLLFYKKHTGRGGVDYEGAVREALCFGWIDSVKRRVDDDSYAFKFTPRKPKSRWSDSNLRRYAELIEAGLLAPAGRATGPPAAAAATVRPGGAAGDAGGSAGTIEGPEYIAAALRSHGEAWSHFQALAPSYRRLYIKWIEAARRQETRLRRLAEAVELLAKNQKLGLK
jgi:uncharacterized protein YdeI (YjbR/CyaY-like superfamily)